MNVKNAQEADGYLKESSPKSLLKIFFNEVFFSKQYYLLNRKRCILFEGAYGQAGRVQVCGQVVDLYVPNDKDKINSKTNGSFFHLNQHFYIKHKDKRIDTLLIEGARPIEDMYAPAVKKAHLFLEILDVHPDTFAKAFFENSPKVSSYPILYKSDTILSRDNGTFAYMLPSSIPMGTYTLRFTLLSVDSVRQNLKDFRYIFKEEGSPLEKDSILGYGKLKIIESNIGTNQEGEYLIISDLDHTFLDTDIEDKEGLMSTIVQSVKEKKLISGMKELLLSLQNDAPLSRPLFFLSASPHFFRRSLAALFHFYGLNVDGIYLKHYTQVVNDISDKVKHYIMNPQKLFHDFNLRHTFETFTKYLSTSFQAFFGNIGYKLEMLLRNRLMQVTSSREILIGDNYEFDFIVFTFYQILLLDLIKKEKLKECLNEFRVMGKEIFTKALIEKIYKLSREAIQLHGRVNPVCFFWINNADHSKTLAHIQNILLGVFRPIFLRAEIHPHLDIEALKGFGVLLPQVCDQGPSMALLALNEGLISIKSAIRIFIHAKDEGGVPTQELKKMISSFHFKNAGFQNEMTEAFNS